MNRRAFITLLGGAAAWPLAARAQQAEKLPTIGYMGSTTATDQSGLVLAFVQRSICPPRPSIFNCDGATFDPAEWQENPRSRSNRRAFRPRRRRGTSGKAC
jgi:hypothetical protein